LKSAVLAGSAVAMAGGKSSSPIWLENAASSDAVSTIFVPSSVPPPSSMRWNLR
jgi:hypothetical protein